MPALLLLFVLPILLVVAAIRLFLAVGRWGFRIGVAGFAALVASLMGAEDWVPLAVFAGVLLLLSVRGRRARPATRPGERVIEQPPAPRSTTTLAPDWAALRRLADWGTRRRIDAARERCERYLLLADAQEDPSAQLPIRIGRHLPTVVDDCVRHCRTATRDEQRELVARTVTTIEGVAEQAERRRVELAHAAQSRFRALQQHLATPGD